jgi:hypothetical protein
MEATSVRGGGGGLTFPMNTPLVLKRCAPEVWGTVGVIGGAGAEDNGDAVANKGASKCKR